MYCTRIYLLLTNVLFFKQFRIYKPNVSSKMIYNLRNSNLNYEFSE